LSFHVRFFNLYLAYLDSNSEDSDSEMSGREVDSDIEKEKEMTYERAVYKSDLIVSIFINTSLD
jgi:hypothetical protein